MRSPANFPPLQAQAMEAGFWGAGLLFTFALFFALAHFESVVVTESPVDFEDLPVVSIPPAPPPPKVTEPIRQPAMELMPLPGIEKEASDSPVMIEVIPPDVAALNPNAQVPPKATISLGLRGAFQPSADVDGDPQHVYQEADVDMRPQAVVRVAPDVTNETFGTASVLRIRLLVLIDADGHAASVHVVKSSGKAAFDELVAQTVKEKWVFSPAIRKGKRVRCLAAQALRFNNSSRDPFTVK